MFALIARRFSVLAAGAVLIAAVAVAPTAVDASGLVTAPQTDLRETPRLQFKPDMVVTPVGVTVDDSGNTYYQFKIKNTGMGLAKNVKVTKLSQVKEVAYPQKLKSTIKALSYDAIPAGQEKPITILCEYSQLYTCKYGSVEVTVENPETSTGNNYASQTS